jgi:ubiquinone/menaquinone biosynthesis C-methylase UbiE
MSRSDEIRSNVKLVWSEAPYYEQAESAEWLEPFWGSQSAFLRLFSRLNLDAVVDLACGRGRHTAQFIQRAGHVSLIDYNESNIAVCKSRFESAPNVSFFVNSGNNIPLDDCSQTALFSYDAMVHFEAADVIAYVQEAARILKSGGLALLHYSNYQENPTGSFQNNPAWRNFFSEKIMLHFSNRTGFKVIQSLVFDWFEAKQSDALILLQRQ